MSSNYRLKNSYVKYKVCDTESCITWPYQIADHNCRIAWVYNKKLGLASASVTIQNALDK